MQGETQWDRVGAEKQRAVTIVEAEADVIRIARLLVARLPLVTYDGGVVTLPATEARALKASLEQLDGVRREP